MDTRLKFAGGEIEISSDELNLMPESNRSAIHAINEGLSANQDMILSGVNAVIVPGVDVTINEGYVFLDGETLKVDAQVVVKTEASDLYQFEKVTTFPSEGERNFRDATTHDIYEIKRAVVVNVGALTSFSVDGDTVIDVLKELIQIQSDWTQADNTQPDYIKNKDFFIKKLMKGTVDFGDINGGSSGAVAVTGDILTATKSNLGSSRSSLAITFPTVGTSSYTAMLNIVDIGSSGSTDVKGWVIIARTATGMTIELSEESGNTQDFILEFTLID
ncbi:MAG: hypothetical protein QQN55_01090 [Nitrosopumilus sp.]